MTIFMNVTDAVGVASNHGITRVERKLALELLGRSDVQFVMMHSGLLWRVGNAAVEALLTQQATNQLPCVERFGVDPSPGHDGRLRASRAALQRRGGSSRMGALGPITLQPVDANQSDVLVSVGLDWSHGLVDEAERLVFGAGVSYVGFCYDTIPIDHPEWLFPPDPAGFQRHLARMSRIASSVLCISERTRSDFARHFPDYPREGLKVLTLGSDAAVDVGPEQSAFAESIFDGEPYAVYCATLDRRKNHQVLYRAMREMERRQMSGNFVFVGMVGSGVGDLMSSLRTDPLVAGRIAHVTNCDDRHLAAIYRHASFAVYPSFYEGWGLGVTEAMAHEKRCIVASGSSLGEASFGTAREVHPLATEQWVDAIGEFFSEQGVVGTVELPTWLSAAAQFVELVAR